MPTLAEVVLPHMSVTQPNNFGDESHLDGRVVSAFVLPSAGLCQAAVVKTWIGLDRPEVT